MFNLLQVLTSEQRERIENYIGCMALGDMNKFIGLDEWLKYWSVEKIKLYKLLGNSFTYKVPFTYNKNENILTNEIGRLVDYHPFAIAFRKFADEVDRNSETYGGDNHNLYRYIYHTVRYWDLKEDKIQDSLRYRRTPESKLLQLQEGMKPMRAISKIVNYFKEDSYFAENVAPHYEDFRLEHSRILNEKVIKGNMVFSIDPIDFMTMSDNGLNWSSCMSWKKDGCYHVGTVEMMNSNNVICCYIEADEPYYFDEKNKDAAHSCPNKKYRQLCYINKDIIVSGKSYPYSVDDLSKIAIGTLKDLAEKNMNWTYQFGPELYQDMKYVNTTFSMGRERDFARHPDKRTGHKIIFDTRGMYNDMLNDHYRKYFCYRNKVKHNKIINVSGKSSCLCCGKPSIEGDFDGRNEWDSWDNIEYNDRYNNVGEVICDNCLQDYHCDICYSHDPVRKRITIVNEDGKTLCLCSACVERWIKVCPVCGKPMLITRGISPIPTYGKATSELLPADKTEYDRIFNYTHDLVRRIYCHAECEKELGEPEIIDFQTRWGREYHVRLFPFKDDEFYDKFELDNLKTPDKITDGEVIRSSSDHQIEN